MSSRNDGTGLDRRAGRSVDNTSRRASLGTRVRNRATSLSTARHATSTKVGTSSRLRQCCLCTSPEVGFLHTTCCATVARNTLEFWRPWPWPCRCGSSIRSPSGRWWAATGPICGWTCSTCAGSICSGPPRCEQPDRGTERRIAGGGRKSDPPQPLSAPGPIHPRRAAAGGGGTGGYERAHAALAGEPHRSAPTVLPAGRGGDSRRPGSGHYGAARQRGYLYNPVSYRGGVLRLHYARAAELGP